MTITSIILSTLLLSAGSGGLTISWTPPPDPDVSYYKIYAGTKSGIYSQTFITSDTSYVSDLTPLQDWYVAVTAVDTAGNESIKSVEVKWTGKISTVLDTTIANEPFSDWWIIGNNAGNRSKIDSAGVTLAADSLSSGWITLAQPVAIKYKQIKINIDQISTDLALGFSNTRGLSNTHGSFFEPNMLRLYVYGNPPYLFLHQKTDGIVSEFPLTEPDTSLRNVSFLIEVIDSTYKFYANNDLIHEGSWPLRDTVYIDISSYQSTAHLKNFAIRKVSGTGNPCDINRDGNSDLAADLTIFARFFGTTRIYVENHPEIWPQALVFFDRCDLDASGRVDGNDLVVFAGCQR